jgi:hypothetical protein
MRANKICGNGRLFAEITADAWKIDHMASRDRNFQN